ncbi:MAG: hypothetical protein ACE5E6_00520 [Phycisphaerae bacterium]
MPRSRVRRGYVLLETVIATGLLVLGLAVIGGQIQESVASVRRMELGTRAAAMAEMQLAMLDTGLIKFDTVDEVMEEAFGPRFPDFAWRITRQETAVDDLFVLRQDVLYIPHRDVAEDFDFDTAEVLNTFYLFRAAPRPVHFGEDFGIGEEELAELSEQLGLLGIEGLDPTQFDPTIFAQLNVEDLLQVLPTLMGALGLELSEIADQLPPEVLEAMQAAGMEAVLGGGDAAGAGTGGGRPDGGGP